MKTLDELNKRIAMVKADGRCWLSAYLTAKGIEVNVKSIFKELCFLEKYILTILQNEHEGKTDYKNLADNIDLNKSFKKFNFWHHNQSLRNIPKEYYGDISEYLLLSQKGETILVLQLEYGAQITKMTHGWMITSGRYVNLSSCRMGERTFLDFFQAGLITESTIIVLHRGNHFDAVKPSSAHEKVLVRAPVKPSSAQEKVLVRVPVKVSEVSAKPVSDLKSKKRKRREKTFKCQRCGHVCVDIDVYFDHHYLNSCEKKKKKRRKKL
jgi:hypothetical protein